MERGSVQKGGTAEDTSLVQELCLCVLLSKNMSSPTRSKLHFTDVVFRQSLFLRTEMFNLQDFSLHHSSVVSQEEDSHRDLIRKKLGREWVSQDSCVVGRLRIEGDSVNSNL